MSIRSFAGSLTAAGLLLTIFAPHAGAQADGGIDSYGQVAASEPAMPEGIVEATTFKTGGCKDYSAFPASAVVSSSVTRDVASFTIAADACKNLKITFSSYNLPGGGVLPFEDQDPIDSKTGVFGAGTHQVKLANGSCNWQSDLYFGDLQPKLNPQHGHTNLFPGGGGKAWAYSENNTCGTGTVTPQDVCAYRGDAGGQLAVFKAMNSTSAAKQIPVGPDNKMMPAGTIAFQATNFAPGVTDPGAVFHMRDLGNGWMSASWLLDGKTVTVNNDTKECDSKPLSGDLTTGALLAGGVAAAVAAGAFALRRRNA